MESGGGIVTTETLTLLTDVNPSFWYPRVYPWMAGIIKDHAVMMNNPYTLTYRPT